MTNRVVDRVSVGIDYLTMTGPVEQVTEARAATDLLLGEPSGERYPRYGYKRAVRYDGEAMFQTQHHASGYMASLPGGACERVGQRQLRGFMGHLLSLGGCTRIDLRVDYHGTGVDYAECCRDACDRDELRRMRSWREFSKRTRGGGVKGLTIYVGAAESECQARLYDKGLERDQAGNQWQRFEAQFRKARAHDVALRLASLDEETYERRVMSLALGVVDFRGGDASDRGDRLERPAWWAEMLHGAKPELTSAQRDHTFDGYAKWLEGSVYPKLRAAGDQFGLSAGQVLDAVVGTQPCRNPDPADPVFLGLLRFLAERGDT